MAVGAHTLPGWMLAWSIFTALICTWDATFIVLRPHSLPGGKYHFMWQPYEFYISIDKAYGDMNNTFVYAQSLMNYVEVLLNVVSVCLHFKGSRETVGVTFTVAVMTFWKSVAYLFTSLPLCGAGQCSLHADLTSSILYMILPNIVWIVMPFLVMVSLWKRLFHVNMSHKVK